MTKYEDPRLPARFWAKSRLADTTERSCWLWTGDVDSNGYPKFGSGNEHCLAGRMAYNVLVGLLPRSSNLKRTCKNIRCINPDHGKPSEASNIAKMNAVTAANRANRHVPTTIETCWICQESVVCIKGKWLDRDPIGEGLYNWTEHRHQPGELRKAAEKEAAGVSAKGRYGNRKPESEWANGNKPTAVDDEEEGEG